jgi:dTDP-3-amino-2,3,6-trideoxy-4-keto-D-glucose/dTDP-3-amino-3,4,6-trideoxy-alpha-D-glucose/dTDP-2,6-dideoxy-D-kanosamine transaminase
MAVPSNDLKRSVAEQRTEIDAAISRVVSTGWYVQGPSHDAFEMQFAEYVGVRHCLGVANGTDALELALRAVTHGRNRPVVVVAANAGGYASTATRAAGLRPRYADVDPDTLCLSAETVAPLLDGHVSAVVTTHLYGRVGQIEPLQALCEERSVALVEDCAQAAGAFRSGQHAGTFGSVGTFSFYPTKNLGALGDAGALVTNDSELADRIRALRQYGWQNKYISVVRGGRNSRLDELQAAILSVRLPRLGIWNERRRQIVAQYRSAAEGSSLNILAAEGPEHSAHLAVAVTESRQDIRALFEEAGVRTEIHYPMPDHWQPTEGSRQPAHLPVTEWASERVLSLPCFPQLTDEEVDLVCEQIARF